MANEVYANNMEISCKAAAGKSICAFPDVCFTPPQTPATPPGVPIPYPNTGMASDTTSGSTSVQISGQEVMLKNKSYFKRSTGDEAGCAPKKGVITSVNMGKVYFTMWSMDVKIEGENVVRMMDLTTHNHASPPGNTPPWAYLDEMAVSVNPNCADEVDRAKTKCKDCETREAQCADEECNKAKKCLLVTYSQGKRKSKGTHVGCCDGEQPHHLVEAHGLCEEGERGTPLPQFKSYDIKEAPCVCAKGGRYEKEHGAFHALVGQQENAAVSTAVGAQKEQAWKYKDAKKAAIDAHSKVFPDSGCASKCLESQLDSYHNGVGVSDDADLRTGTQALQDWQKQSAEQVIKDMKDQLGEPLGAFGD